MPEDACHFGGVRGEGVLLVGEPPSERRRGGRNPPSGSWRSSARRSWGSPAPSGAVHRKVSFWHFRAEGKALWKRGCLGPSADFTWDLSSSGGRKRSPSRTQTAASVTILVSEPRGICRGHFATYIYFHFRQFQCCTFRGWRRVLYFLSTFMLYPRSAPWIYKDTVFSGMPALPGGQGDVGG